MNNQSSLFDSALYLKHHPILSEQPQYRAQYVSALRYVIEKCRPNDVSSKSMLDYYADEISNGDCDIPEKSVPSSSEILHIAKRIQSTRIGFYNRTDFMNRPVQVRSFGLFSYRYVFLIDSLLLCGFFERPSGLPVLTTVKELFHPRYHKKLDALYDELYSDTAFDKRFAQIFGLIDAWRKNRNYLLLPTKRIIITATMSAGKSTLINAIIGKPLARTSQEACTANLHYYYSKAFEDEITSMQDKEIRFDICRPDLDSLDDNSPSNISTFFRTMKPYSTRICIIDTPGVNSAINITHGDLTRNALKHESFNMIVYVFHAGGLGRDEEHQYLKYLSDTVPKDKIVFVVNRLDEFRRKEDSIKASIEKIRTDLENLGFESPHIFPFSAQLALLIKSRLNGNELDEDQEDDLKRLIVKFRKPEFDLSKYYEPFDNDLESDELIQIAKHCGLLGLEKVLYEGVTV